MFIDVLYVLRSNAYVDVTVASKKTYSHYKFVHSFLATTQLAYLLCFVPLTTLIILDIILERSIHTFHIFMRLQTVNFTNSFNKLASNSKQTEKKTRERGRERKQERKQ